MVRCSEAAACEAAARDEGTEVHSGVAAGGPEFLVQRAVQARTSDGLASRMPAACG